MITKRDKKIVADWLSCDEDLKPWEWEHRTAYAWEVLETNLGLKVYKRCGELNFDLDEYLVSVDMDGTYMIEDMYRSSITKAVTLPEYNRYFTILHDLGFKEEEYE